MSNLILFDEPTLRTALLPFTFTRPVAGIRVGIQTVAEKWADIFNVTPSFLTMPYLQPKFPALTGADNLYINGAVCPTPPLKQVIDSLDLNQGLITSDGMLIALRTERALTEVPGTNDTTYSFQPFTQPLTVIRHVWDIFGANGEQIRADFARITAGRQSQPITDPFTRCYASENIFLEEGATVKAAILNAEAGPIYIGRNATVSEGAIIVGPFSLGEESAVNLGGKMRPNTTVGPFSKVGGEVNNAVFFGFSNKGHDGFLGNAVIGEWCNLGANVNNSNLKNDYSHVKLHSYATGQLEDTGRMFCGLMLGDFSRVGISTMFNTGTVVGVSTNVFGGSFQPKFIPSFAWGGTTDGFTTYRIDKALQVAREAFARRGKSFDDIEESILRTIADHPQSHR
jgi:UDP-N-acetylglucosamine diphosphorylase/glucosamine-1-phosphate N-acetyltransferase